MSAPYYDPATGRCPHGVRYPHECREGCEDEPLGAPYSLPREPTAADLAAGDAQATIAAAHDAAEEARR